MSVSEGPRCGELTAVGCVAAQLIDFAIGWHPYHAMRKQRYYSEMLVKAAATMSMILSLIACGASSASPASTPAVDRCLVGTWTTTPLSGSSVQDGELITYSGGQGETFTITASGAVTIKTSDAAPIIMSAPTRTFTLTTTGTGVGKVTTNGSVLTFTPGPQDTLISSFTASDGSSQNQPGNDRAFSALYTCVAGESFTYNVLADDRMVYAATVSLTATRSSG
jgi:hypothetical protein